LLRQKVRVGYMSPANVETPYRCCKPAPGRVLPRGPGQPAQQMKDTFVGALVGVDYHYKHKHPGDKNPKTE